MKALVLCGGIPQAALIEELKSRSIYTILADINPQVIARPCADKFYPISAFDVGAVKKLAKEENVDFILTACADQVLLVQAQVSEELGLPCYIDYKTAKDVSNKKLMKEIFVKNNVPTSKYVIMKKFNADIVKHLKYPIIVKPVDSYSSRGIRKVFNIVELKDAFDMAIKISRTKTCIIEEFIEGEEITVDVYIEDGKAHVLCISNIDKIPENNKFVICRTRYPAQISSDIRKKVEDISEKIAKAFNLQNSPMLIQMIINGEDVSVIEFCARTGGGDKFRLIKKVSNFDVIKAIVDLTLGVKPHIKPYMFSKYIVTEFLYTKPGILDHFEGFDEMLKQGIISEYFQLKNVGMACGETNSSSDRVAYYMIQGATIDEIREKEQKANENLKVIDINSEDILQHNLISAFQ